MNLEHLDEQAWQQSSYSNTALQYSSYAAIVTESILLEILKDRAADPAGNLADILAIAAAIAALNNSMKTYS